ncbi:ATP-dependent Clp protease proteolytic subunit, partial [Bacillus sp. WP8]|uniref:ATP-dependent Clp protease proteolytic subunit n=1 Tax=Bacillus sp. WP8 TaxID=756828 RepID=UPI0016425B41
MNLIPTLIQQTDRRQTPYHIYSPLLKHPIIMLDSPIHHNLPNSILSQLLFLQPQHPQKHISIYINTPPPSITPPIAIYHTIQFIKPKLS